jgi:hypothetical protein
MHFGVLKKILSDKGYLKKVWVHCCKAMYVVVYVGMKMVVSRETFTFQILL